MVDFVDEFVAVAFQEKLDQCRVEGQRAIAAVRRRGGTLVNGVGR